MAVETMPFGHAAITLMTGAGIVVVEAAGNGQTLVAPASTVDSGALVVGASSNNLVPACFTNFGPRVDVHAWGQSIGTLGGSGTVSVIRRDAAGNIVRDAAGKPIVDDVLDPSQAANGPDVRQFYTRDFGGTSGASPIVVGAAALVQSTRAARGLAKLTPIDLRSLLIRTGTPQAPGTLGTGSDRCPTWRRPSPPTSPTRPRSSARRRRRPRSAPARPPGAARATRCASAGPGGSRSRRTPSR